MPNTSGAIASHGYEFVHLAANAETLVKTGAGVLHSITINTAGASSNLVTVYDGTSTAGAVIAIINSTIAQAPIRMYDTKFSVGLYIAIATGTAPDITVAYL